MKADTTKAMQDALQAAVRSMSGNGNGNGGGTDSTPSVPRDTIGAIMSILPKLLQTNDASEELVERLDSLQKGDLATLKEQVLILRKQCHRMLKFQEQIFVEMHELQSRQSAMHATMVELTEQMARVEILPGPFGEEVAEERETPRDSGQQARREAVNEQRRAPSKTAKNPNRPRP